ncbi:CynX/NimT family MFS transporter [Frondihabitans australicus]|uniref:CP family cyanate transporter-like MFS transporter n=1 Tax=Frondihabitans australicus TaxID=386892 RepID=A0A495IIE3_9MICO|nr:MFS transporter [Frondihabitans australicus]RKR75754.1 CP family cyanate transporter-like MFS transporter [Frondihabitans australicus]
MSGAAARAARSPIAWLLTLAIVLIALNLRGTIVAVAPVIGPITSDLGLSTVVAGLLTSIPVLCFAVASPLASAVIARLGAERAVTISLLGIVAGTLLRSAGSSAALIAGTVLIGVSITVGNVVVPVVIRRDFAPERVGIVTGIYTSALNVGSMITSLGTAPIAEATGWPIALVVWGAFAVIAGVVWCASVGVRSALLGAPTLGEGPQDLVTGPIEVITASIPVVRAAATDATETPERRSLFRRWSTWGLTLAFAGQAFGYYGLTAWIPTLLHSEVGLSAAGAGASSSVFQILAVVGALGVPVLALRWHPVWIIGLVGLLWLVMPLGLLFAPHLWLVWSLFGGVAQGGGITIVFIIIVRMATTDVEARRLSALVQGCGYALASLGPLVVGGVHGATGGWTAPMLVVFVSVLTLGVSGVLSARRLR